MKKRENKININIIIKIGGQKPSTVEIAVWFKTKKINGPHCISWFLYWIPISISTWSFSLSPSFSSLALCILLSLSAFHHTRHFLSQGPFLSLDPFLFHLDLFLWFPFSIFTFQFWFFLQFEWSILRFCFISCWVAGFQLGRC